MDNWKDFHLTLFPTPELPGVPFLGLRLVVVLFANALVGVGHRYAVTPTSRNAYSACFGLLCCYLFVGFDVVFPIYSAAATYFVFLLSHLGAIPRQFVSIIVFFCSMAYLLWGFIEYSTEGYDIDWTTIQCVLTLRLSGIAFDYSDGALEDSKLSTEQKKRAIKTIPSPLEFVAFSFYYGAVLIGPQMHFRKYLSFANLSLFPNNKQPSSSGATLHRLGFVLLYLGLGLYGSTHFPSSYIRTDEFINEPSFLKRVWDMWWCMKFQLTQYVSIWMLGELGCISSGVGFVAQGEGKHKWDGVSNVQPIETEVATTLNQYIKAFNINTNEWCAHYVFKRLRFLGNKNLSFIGTVMFLAIWHGYAPGYFICFFMEFVEVTCEQSLKRRFEGFNATVAKSNSAARFAWGSVCWLLRTFALHCPLMVFVCKDWQSSMAAWGALYFLPFLVPVGYLVVDTFVIPVRKERKKEQ